MDISKLTNDYKKLTTKGKIVFKAVAHGWIGNEYWAHIVTPESTPLLQQAWDLACRRLNIAKKPLLVLYKSNYVNGFYADGNCIFLSTGAVDALSDPNLLFVMGHELGHYRSTRRRFLEQCAAMGVGLFGLPALFETVDWSKVDPFKNPLLQRAAKEILAAYIFFKVFSHTLYRDEFRADAAGAEVVGSDRAVKALETTEAYIKQQNQQGDAYWKFSWEQAKLDLINSLRWMLTIPLRYHPSFERRKNALLADKAQEGDARSR